MVVIDFYWFTFLNLEFQYLNIILDFYNVLKFINYACDFYYLIKVYIYIYLIWTICTFYFKILVLNL